MGGVIFEKIGQSVGVNEIVDRDDFETPFVISSPKRETANASKSVDG
jgi:hypothetical protein